MPFIKINHVSKKFEDAYALKPLSFEIKEDEKIAIVGETGSGKSTLLKIIGGLLATDSGHVLYQEDKVLGPEDKLIPGHSDIVYLSQHFELPKFISVFEHLNAPYEIAESEARKIYEACQIAHLLDKNTRQLSGGEKQRVALAKVLLKSPRVLLLDEPFSNLDNIHKQIIKEVLEGVKQLWELTIIMVSHEPKDVLPWADTIVVMKEGSILQSDAPKVIYSQPVNEYVAGLFGKFNLIDPKEWGIPSKRKSSNDFGGMMLVRPEEFHVTTDPSQGKNGIVSQVDFYGNYYEVTIKINNKTSILVTVSKLYKVDDQVVIALDQIYL